MKYPKPSFDPSSEGIWSWVAIDSLRSPDDGSLLCDPYPESHAYTFFRNLGAKLDGLCCRATIYFQVKWKP